FLLLCRIKIVSSAMLSWVLQKLRIITTRKSHILDPLLGHLATVLPRGSLYWTAKRIVYRRTTVQIPWMVELFVYTSLFGTLRQYPIMLYYSLAKFPIVPKVFQAIENCK